MTRKFYTVVLISFAMMSSFVPGALAAPPQAAAKAPSLYTQLGGYDALAAVTDDFINALATDPQLGKFFVGLNDTSKQRVRQHVIDFLCNATGGPCLYLGQDMKTAHKGLHITEAEWNTSAQHLVDTLNKFKVPQAQQTAVMGAISALKGDIVGQ
jgi:hemoglobin